MDLVHEREAGEETKRARIVEGSRQAEGRNLGVLNHKGVQADAMQISGAKNKLCRERGSEVHACAYKTGQEGVESCDIGP